MRQEDALWQKDDAILRMATLIPLAVGVSAVLGTIFIHALALGDGKIRSPSERAGTRGFKLRAMLQSFRWRYPSRSWRT
jgi:hypothetical protein